MIRLFGGKPHLGIEITDKTVKVVVVSGRGKKGSVLYTKTAEVPDGAVSESFASPNIDDFFHLNAVVSECLTDAPSNVRRTALSLPDSVFRVQTVEFDELPAKAEEREHLIRWRLEKGATFDSTETVLRYQVLERQDKGFTVLSCVAKQAVISQYESLLTGLGLEPWVVGPSSFHALNFYSSYLTKKSKGFALAYLSEDFFATIIMETSGVKFYRYKEVKRGSAEDIRGKLMREIDDSLHFYTHMNRLQQSRVEELYLTGESVVSADLAEGLKTMTPLNVEVLLPAVAIQYAEGIGPDMAAALGAGSLL